MIVLTIIWKGQNYMATSHLFPNAMLGMGPGLLEIQFTTSFWIPGPLYQGTGTSGKVSSSVRNAFVSGAIGVCNKNNHQNIGNCEENCKNYGKFQ